jgi:uncharacterized protein (DUF433 family)
MLREKLRIRWDMDWEERITADPNVLVGKPIVRGTRIAVEFVIDLLASRWTERQILDNYPILTAEDVEACLHYANELVKSERVYPVGS